MADLNALLDVIPVGDIAKQLGIDENVAELAVKQVLPGLVGGLAANAHDDRGQEVLGNVLKHHNTGVARSVDEVDTEDGEKIVRNVFGDNTDKVVDKLANKASSSGSDITGEIIKQVLPIVAPIVLSWLANQFLGGGSSSSSSSAAAEPAESSSSSGGIGDLLGGLLSSPQGQEIAGDLLGGLLGGGKR
ncbi:MAG: DUF937 domain-containing protein [Microbacteriaceae bacterium]|nr:DUF937 domain-containing protein [Microbacteriaceae bacterium]